MQEQPRVLDGSPAGNELNDGHDERDEQQDVEQAAYRVRGGKTQRPEYQQHQN
jgi:hypothetical protein